jgi:hypothetical protein
MTIRDDISWGEIQGIAGLTGTQGLTGITGWSGYTPPMQKQGLKHTSSLMDMYPEKTIGFFAQLCIWLGFKDKELF